MRRIDRARHMRKYFGDILNIESDEAAIKLWTKKPKHMAKEKEIYIIPRTGRDEYDKEAQSLIDSMAKIVDDIDEWIDKWFGC